MGRKRASSSVSLSPSPSVERKRQPSAVVLDNDKGSTSTRIPRLGSVIKGFVKATIEFGAFVTVPDFMDGLVHNTRKQDKLSKGQTIFAKVVLVSDSKYALDMRFVDQTTGRDTDPDNEERIRLEPAIASGKFTDYLLTPSNPRADDEDGCDVLRNKIYKATVFKKLAYGYFVSLEGAIHRGLLPSGKCTGELKVGDSLYLKVVEILTKAKFNCDMRYVDQKNGKDLDPSNKHSSDRLGGPREEKSSESRPTGRRRHDSESPRVKRRKDRSESASPIRRRRDDVSESPAIKRRTGRDAHSPAIRRNDRSESPIKRRTGKAADSPAIRRNKNDRSESPVKRAVVLRRNKDRSESPIKRRKDKEESPAIIRRKRDERRSESPPVQRRKRDRSNDSSSKSSRSEIIRRRR